MEIVFWAFQNEHNINWPKYFSKTQRATQLTVSDHYQVPHQTEILSVFYHFYQLFLVVKPFFIFKKEFGASRRLPSGRIQTLDRHDEKPRCWSLDQSRLTRVVVDSLHDNMLSELSHIFLPFVSCGQLIHENSNLEPSLHSKTRSFHISVTSWGQTFHVLNCNFRIVDQVRHSEVSRLSLWTENNKLIITDLFFLFKKKHPTTRMIPKQVSCSSKMQIFVAG